MDMVHVRAGQQNFQGLQFGNQNAVYFQASL